ncbi:hypothetical protein SAMN05216228_10616 [Rhizobium tibeticum]|uniref:N-acetyltransferase domain-containing protein n=1 Tax=Rhizobium tibeticum TaxID=501024 RepID=A0A1H8WC98_9HYPH|nr:hypothetical protein RTCCBAU85039_6439 [Rhizobium tibeticum]SEP25239.1 hypothetical protein SAMN05216228_10616 [Rhizobium tibeticum]
MEARPAHKVVELGYVLFTPTMQRTTLSTGALFLIMRQVFDDLGYQRLEWTCTAENTRSRSRLSGLVLSMRGHCVLA